ncbi:hypothetical protein HMPREF9013_1061 [Bulleidia extructa W1219]|uniref:Uncharacterized protein n=1 Tax=Bulleidia extructa W1219 TaxID=679192 RepID=D2MMS7_9FIRM|nr:hypothetical protein [Bulleidia extructa]EFC06353.1 hypothetical protein HMPREF9013_1061 [Bulleidia extructa W1219]
MDEKTFKLVGEKTGLDWGLDIVLDNIEYKTYYLEDNLGQYPNFDHDHCELCFEKIMNIDGCEKEGYVTLDFYYWLCKDCFSKYHQYLSAKLLQEDSFKGLTIFEVMDTELMLFDGKYEYEIERLEFFFNKIQNQPIKKVDLEIYPIIRSELANEYRIELRHRKVILRNAGIAEILAYLEQIEEDQEVLNYASFNTSPRIKIHFQKRID